MAGNFSFLSKILFALILILIFLLLTSCYNEVERFSLSCRNPGTIALREDPGVRKRKEGLLLKADRFKHGHAATPLYTFESFPHVSGQTAFIVHYSSRLDTKLELFYAEEPVPQDGDSRNKSEDKGRKSGRSRDLPRNAEKVEPRNYEKMRKTLPSTEGREVKTSVSLQGRTPVAFRVIEEESGKEIRSETEEAIFKIEGISLDAPADGIGESGGIPLFSAGIRGWESVVWEGEKVSVGFPEKLVERGGRFSQTRISFEYSYTFPNGGEAEKRPISMLRLSGHSDADKKKTEEARFRLYINGGTHTVHFYTEDLGFIPTLLELEAPEIIGGGQRADSGRSGGPHPGGFDVKSLEIEEVTFFAEESPVPLEADIGTILRYKEKLWRRSDWELFSWNLFPDILVFDFKSYDIQSDFLKRLAFYVEKEGFTGELHSDEVIGELHGWNAHDYRAEDLAEFFNVAEKSDFELNRRERLLADILVDNDVLDRKGRRYRPGEGGLISISQESSDRLRYLFATHEGYHGLYFSSKEYRKRVASVWESLSEKERRFWRLFLRWRTYNVDDPYLLENEFQAYLMQQDISHVESYYKDYIIPRFIELFPEHEEAMMELIEEYPDHFLESARRVEEAAMGTVGIAAGDLLCLRPGEE